MHPNGGVQELGLVGENVKGEFILINKTEKPIQITKVRAGCGSCTTSEWTREPIPSDGHGFVGFELLADRVSKGHFRKYLYVMLEGFHKPVKLAVEGELVRRPRPVAERGGFDLPRVFFGDVLPDEKWERVVILTLPKGTERDYVLESVSAGTDALDVEDVSVADPGRWKFKISPRPPMPVGEVDTRLNAVLKQRVTGRIRRYECEIRGFVGYRLIAYRQRVMFRESEGGQAERVRLALSKGGTLDAAKLKAKTDGAGMRVRFVREKTQVFAELMLEERGTARAEKGDVTVIYPGATPVKIVYWRQVN